jgi:hypothetical protein
MSILPGGIAHGNVMNVWGIERQEEIGNDGRQRHVVYYIETT